MPERQNRSDEGERRDAQAIVEHEESIAETERQYSTQSVEHNGMSRPTKGERPAAVNFASCMLCVARIKDGFSTPEALADAVVLACLGALRDLRRRFRPAELLPQRLSPAGLSDERLRFRRGGRERRKAGAVAARECRDNRQDGIEAALSGQMHEQSAGAGS